MGFIEHIEIARGIIDRVFVQTPQYRSEGLSDLLNASILCKVETMNPIGSFKGRGVAWWLSQQMDLSRVVCASVGNFGQAVAYLCGKAGIPSEVFTAVDANPSKLEAIARFGAVLHQEGADFDAAKEAARMYAADQGYAFLEDGHHPAIAEGAGTMAAELGEWPGPIDIVYVPIGNGALANGVGHWFRQQRPGTKVVGVSTEGAPAMYRSWHQEQAVSTERVQTIADGIAVRVPVPAALDLLATALDDFILVSDQNVEQAMRAYFEKEHIIVEPAGAVSLAGAMVQQELNHGKTIATLLCGSNIDPRYARSQLGLV